MLRPRIEFARRRDLHDAAGIHHHHTIGVAATTPRSWVIRISAEPVSRVSSLSRSRICACTVTSSAVVGSSAMISRGCAGQRHRDHDALAHAAGVLVRIGVEPARGVGDAHPPEQLVRGLVGLRPGVPRCRLIGSATCMPTVSAGLSDDIGSWKIIAMLLPRIARMSASSSFSSRAVEQDLAALDPAGRIRDQAQQRERGDALARAGFADDRQRLAGDDVERHVIDRGHGAALGAEPRREVVDLEQRARHRRVCRSVAHLLLHLLVDPDAGVDRARAAPRRRATRRRSSSPTATRPYRRTAWAARCRAPCRGSPGSSRVSMAWRLPSSRSR